jgi:hypothetical protein
MKATDTENMGITTRTYQYGGTLDPNQNYYIRREADDKLLDLCLQGEYAHIFNARQTGKSSLLVRTRQELEKHGRQAIVIDLQQLGSVTEADRWYYNVAHMIAGKLDLTANLKEWWSAQTTLTPTYRWVMFFKYVVLMEVSKPIVIFIDEIDRTRALPFRDDIFSALRQMYNDRATASETRRLTFVLAGLATPQELIGDLGMTSYNIGEAVELGDLPEKGENVKELAQGLGLANPKKGQWTLRRILGWTGGHPYLTQKLCALVANLVAKEHRTNCSARDIDQLVANEFIGAVKKDNNLLYVEKELTKEREGEITRAAVLGELGRVLDGGVPDRNSAVQAELKLTGVVKVEDGHLEIRNRIYKKVFDRKWLHRKTNPSPRERWRTIRRRVRLFIIRLLIIVILLVVITTFIILSVPQLREPILNLFQPLLKFLPR